VKKLNTIEKSSKIQGTEFIFTDVIDTPYPHCIIPKKHFNELRDSVEKSIANQWKNPPPRSLLSVTTWDGRELFELRSVIK
jgi:hypothetical protein